MSGHTFGEQNIGHRFGKKARIGRNVDMSIRSENTVGVGRDEVDAAVAELREFVEQLRRDGVVAPDGSVTDPGAVVAAVQSQPGRLKALAHAIGAGAKDAVLSVMRDGVADLVVGLVGRM